MLTRDLSNAMAENCSSTDNIAVSLLVQNKETYVHLQAIRLLACTFSL